MDRVQKPNNRVQLGTCLQVVYNFFTAGYGSVARWFIDKMVTVSWDLLDRLLIIGLVYPSCPLQHLFIVAAFVWTDWSTNIRKVTWGQKRQQKIIQNIPPCSHNNKWEPTLYSFDMQLSILSHFSVTTLVNSNIFRQNIYWGRVYLLFCVFNDTHMIWRGWQRDWLTVNWKECGRRLSWPNLRYCPCIYLEGLRKTTQNLSQGSWFLLRDGNAGRWELPTTWPQTLLFLIKIFCV
jgi:hypothetical protein